MDAKTEKALKESIAHWYRISATTTVNELIREGYRSADCSLCREFRGIHSLAYEPQDACAGCPVRGKTGRRYCEAGPYYLAEKSLDAWRETGEWYNTDQDNIEAEIRFLESLLP